MPGVQLIEVAAAEGDQRLDRWFRKRFPGLGHGKLEKLLRTGQIRVNGARAKAATRLDAGMTIRIPPLGDDADAPPKPSAYPPRAMRPDEIAELRQTILYIDDEVIAIDKPPGLAVQGGTGTSKHLDGMLEALRFEAAERPRLVHRLDKETSGVLLLARTAASARWLSEAFRSKAARKTYWAAVVGLPKPRRGKIDLAVVKASSHPEEEDEAREAQTYYTVIDHAGSKASWLALMPMTGRTHQLRIHCAAIDTPILGDSKHGSGNAEIEGLPQAGRLHLHARSIRLPRPKGPPLTVTASLPPHMVQTWEFLGWSTDLAGDPFAELDTES